MQIDEKKEEKNSRGWFILVGLHYYILRFQPVEMLVLDEIFHVSYYFVHILYAIPTAYFKLQNEIVSCVDIFEAQFPSLQFTINNTIKFPIVRF